MEIVSYVGLGLLGLLVVSVVIIKLTKNTKDDAFISKIADFLGMYVSPIMTEKQKELLDIAKKILNGDITAEQAKKEYKEFEEK